MSIPETNKTGNFFYGGSSQQLEVCDTVARTWSSHLCSPLTKADKSSNLGVTVLLWGSLLYRPSPPSPFQPPNTGWERRKVRGKRCVAGTQLFSADKGHRVPWGQVQSSLSGYPIASGPLDKLQHQGPAAAKEQQPLSLLGIWHLYTLSRNPRIPKVNYFQLAE